MVWLTRIHAHRYETPLWFNAVVCTIPFVIGVAIYWLLATSLGIWAAAIAIVLIIFVPSCILCVLPRKYLIHWYMEFTEEGFTNCVLGRRRFYPWEEVVQVTSERHPNFTRPYDNILVIETKDTTYKYFLQDYGIEKKSKIIQFIEDVKKLFHSQKTPL